MTKGSPPPDHERCDAYVLVDGVERRCMKFWDEIISGRRFCFKHAKEHSDGKTKNGHRRLR